MERTDVGTRDFVRPVFSLCAAIAATLLCGAAVGALSSQFTTAAAKGWGVFALLAGIGALILGVRGVADGEPGRRACLGSIALVAVIVVVALAVTPFSVRPA